MNSDREMISIQDVRRAGYCISGAREWCNLREISFRDLVRRGVPASDVENLGDPIVEHILKVKRSEGDGQ